MKNAWPITDEHRLATILHPKFKNLECCPDEKEKSINLLKLELDKYQANLSSSNTTSSTSILLDSQAAPLTPAKNPTMKRKNLLAQCFDSKIHLACTPKNPPRSTNPIIGSHRIR
jgi:hypothetical protein